MKLYTFITLLGVHLTLFSAAGYGRESDLSGKYTQLLDLMAPDRKVSSGEVDQEDQISLRLDMLYQTLKTGKTFSPNLGLPQNKRAFEGLYGGAVELALPVDSSFDAKIYQQIKSRADKNTSGRNRLDLLLLTAYLQQTYLELTPGSRNTEFGEKILKLLKEIMTPVQYDLFIKKLEKMNTGNGSSEPGGHGKR